MLDHPIFLQSIQFIRRELGETNLEPLEQSVLERLIHTSGDFGIRDLLRFTPDSCLIGLSALKQSSAIIADTSIATAAIKPMANRINIPVHNVLNWAPEEANELYTRTAFGMKQAWQDLQLNTKDSVSPIVVIGSAPTALETLLDLVDQTNHPPSLIIGMPVGFIGVEKSKQRLISSNIPSICLDGTRGGASLAASVVNALIREII